MRFLRRARRPSRRNARPSLDGLEFRQLLVAGGLMPIAALGDSLTDEYSFGDPPPAGPPGSLAFAPPSQIYLAGCNSARNWPLILSALRAGEVTFGAYTSADQGVPRAQGFAEDWARGGAAVGASADDLSDGTLARQLYGNATSPGYLTQSKATTGTKPTDIGAVTIMIGTNNYLLSMLDALQSDGAKDAFMLPKGSTLTPVNATVEAGIVEAVAAIQAASPTTRIVLVTPSDITETPFVQARLAPFGDQFAPLVAEIKASIAALTGDMTRFAHQFHFGLVDMDGVIDDLRSRPQIAGLAVHINGAGADPGDAYVGDGFHFGTPIQGRLAQAIVAAIDQLGGSEPIDPLTDAELAVYASLTTPKVAVTGVTTRGSTTTTLSASVVNGLGATFAPTGTVTFAQYIAGDARTPPRLGTILGQVTLSKGGSAALTVPTSALADAPVVAIYGGDLRHTRQFSPTLTAEQVVTTDPHVVPLRRPHRFQHPRPLKRPPGS